MIFRIRVNGVILEGDFVWGVEFFIPNLSKHFLLKHFIGFKVHHA